MAAVAEAVTPMVVHRVLVVRGEAVTKLPTATMMVKTAEDHIFLEQTLLISVAVVVGAARVLSVQLDLPVDLVVEELL